MNRPLITNILVTITQPIQVRIQDLCKGPKRDFADIVQWSCGSGKNLGLKIGGHIGPTPPLRSAPAHGRLTLVDMWWKRCALDPRLSCLL